MEQKSQKTTLEEETLRFKMLQLLKTDVKVNLIPLNAIELVLECLQYFMLFRFSIDYFTSTWLGDPQPIFSYLDLSYYLRFASQNACSITVIVSLIYMNLYWLVHAVIFFADKKLSNIALNVKKLIFIITKNLFFLPLLNIVLSLFRPTKDSFNFTYESPLMPLKVMAVLSFVLFLLFIVGQSFLNFQFLKIREGFTRTRKSAFQPTCLLLFFVLNQTLFFCVDQSTQFLILNASSILLLILFGLKNEQLNQRTKLIELGFLVVNMVAFFSLDLCLVLDQTFSLQLFLLVSAFVMAGVMHVNTYSLEFQIQNINKWPTSDIIIQYTAGLRTFLNRRSEYLFNVNIQGYMELHRHKCDYSTCPSRCALSEYETSLFQSGVLQKKDEDLLRCQNVVKRIYQDGYKESPVNSELQLDNSIFLYEKGEKQVALKSLLQVNFSSLALDKYYQYNYLKEKIHSEMCEEPDQKFLDLVSQLRVKHEEEQIAKKMEKAALINLEFWSTLNQDHPDFQKLNEVAFNRIEIREQIHNSYSLICSIASSEKVTSLYVQYLEAIENDEAMFNTILDGIRQEFQLSEKLVLKDWANTSQAIMVVSIQEQNYGTIIDINSSCAMLLGYEKYQIMNHSIKFILPEDLGDDIKQFLSKNHIEETYFMAHKSGYLIKTNCKSQSYNSMNTGMATVISLTSELSPDTCYFVLGKKTQRILGVSASMISLVGLQQKIFQEPVPAVNFFKQPLEQLITMAEDSNNSYRLNELINCKYEQDIIDSTMKPFRLKYYLFQNCSVIALQQISKMFKSGQALEIKYNSNFEFQIQATLSSFKFFGCRTSHESYISQFSQLSYAQSLKMGPTMRNYGFGISTLRLRDSIIQVIEENEHEDIEGSKQNKNQLNSQIMEIPHKEQEQIFQSRSTFINFIEEYSFGNYLILIMIISKLVLITLYIFYYIVMTNHNNDTGTLSSYLVYNNLMAGAVTKELSLADSIMQMKAGQSLQDVSNFVSTYNDNLKYATEIRFLGGDQYNLSIFLGMTSVTFLNHEFLLSFLDNANIISNAISPAKNQSQIVASLGATEMTALQYLMINCASAKEAIIGHSKQLQQLIENTIGSFKKSEILLLMGGIGLVILISIVKMCAIWRINKERNRIFDVFLDITDVQIQTFSSKTEKFLTSLHAQDINGEIDIDEEVENTRKISSSTFTKKKRFKNPEIIDNLFFKFIVVGLICSAFFLHSFILNNISLNFELGATDYFFYTSAAEYKFYSGLSQIQSAALYGKPLPTELSKTYIEYYKKYFELHYSTYGNVNEFHDTMTSALMLDICNGTQTKYGSTQIPQSCQLPQLYPNGSYLVFTDMAMKTEGLKDASSLTDPYILDYQVVSKSHRILSEDLLAAEKELEHQTNQNLLIALIIWILVLAIAGTWFILGSMKGYISRLNKTKNILTVLPISVGKNLSKLTQYCSSIIQSKCCS